jgi:hypothetical protein
MDEEGWKEGCTQRQKNKKKVTVKKKAEKSKKNTPGACGVYGFNFNFRLIPDFGNGPFPLPPCNNSRTAIL